MTYLKAYQLHLEAQMELGGTPASMETAVREYNNIGRPDFPGSATFTAWAKGYPHSCENCQGEFKQDVVPEPAAASLCGACGPVEASSDSQA